MVKISIVIPCLEKPKDLINDIKQQTFKDYEIVFSMGKMPIPQAYQRGVEMAKGEQMVFLGADSRIYEKTWLAEMTKLIDQYKIVEADNVIVNDHIFTDDNFGVESKIMKDNPFDETVSIGQDTEWFMRMQSKGYKITHTRRPLAWQYRTITPGRTIYRGFNYGVTYVKIAMTYDCEIDFKRLFLSRAHDLVWGSCIFFGEIYGFIRYFPVLFKKKPDKVQSTC